MKKQSINIDERFKDYVKAIKDVNPDLTDAACIRYSVRYCAMFKILFFPSPDVEHTTINGVKEKQKKESKEDWCRAFGGEVKNGVCYIDKYEKTVSGHVVKQPRVIPISAFPIDRGEFKRDIIQNEETLEDAIANWKLKPIE